MTYVPTRDRAELDERRRAIVAELRAGAADAKRVAEIDAELVEIEGEINDAVKYGDAGYCEHCGHEQAPPTREEPRCERCGGWLYADVRA